MGGGVEIHAFLTSALVESEWSASRLSRFTSEERTPGTNSITVWMGPITSRENMERTKFLILPGLVLRPLGRPDRQRCPGSRNITGQNKKGQRHFLERI
jgi:hypothetical protein